LGNNSGNTPLHWASLTGQKPIVEMLCEKKVDVNAKNSFGRIAMEEALLAGHQVIAEFLAPLSKMEDDKVYVSSKFEPVEEEEEKVEEEAPVIQKKEVESPESVPDTDPQMQKLFEWARSHGAVINGCTRIDKGVRGFYTSDKAEDIVIKVPNKLIISPHHISSLPFHEKQPYQAVFSLAPQLFDPAHPTEPNDLCPEKIDNAHGEWFQMTFFLITERLKGEKSFFEPYLAILPPVNESLATLLGDQKLVSEIQRESDDILKKAAYEHALFEKCEARFGQFIAEHGSALKG